MQTHLMRGIRQQFVDAFLTSCTVEVFSPDEEIIIRGNISNDLYLLVGGTVNLINWFSGQETENDDNNDGQTNSNGQNGNRPSDTLSEGDALTMSIGDSDFNTTIKNNPSTKIKKLQAGEFVNPISFFCESPQVETVRTSTVCKVLTLSRASYNSICMDHPGSVGKILCNLLESVEETAAELGEVPTVALPQQISLLRAGSEFDDNKGGMSESQYIEEIQRTVAVVQNQAALTSVRDLVTTHINKLKDDHTTRFLFAASRNDVPTITLMCNQGIDPNSSDYDGRTALMQAAMKGNLEALAKLLDYQANLNLVDVHGNSALHEAVRGGHEKCIELMLEQGAELCMSDTDAASALNQCVFDGDVKMLRRLLRCDIQIDAGDYDKRRAVHIGKSVSNNVHLSCRCLACCMLVSALKYLTLSRH
jgi:CRP-like cAMP-binding protein